MFYFSSSHIVKRSFFVIFMFILFNILLSVSVIAQEPVVTNVTPKPNVHTATLTTTISIQYNQPIDAHTVTSQTIPIYSAFRGKIPGLYGVSGNTITFTPTNSFLAGELLSVIATTHTLNITGTAPITPTIWQFRTETQRGSGIFLGGKTPIEATVADANLGDIAVGDLDNDGDLDVFVTNRDPNGDAPNSVWFNDGKGNFTDSGQKLGTSYSVNVKLGDLDGDGDLDAFVKNGYHSAPEPDTVWFNDGTGTFTDSGQRIEGDDANIALGDVDGDGDLDAFVGDNSGSRVLLNNGSGFFSDSGQTIGSDVVSAVGLGDLDNDGDLDAFVTFFHSFNGVSNESIYLNDGHGVFTFYAYALYGYYGWNSQDVALGDIEEDGDLDAFVAISPNHANMVYLNDGRGGFSSNGQDPVSGFLLGDSTSYGVDFGDVDADGDLDAFVGNGSQPDKVWLNNGGGFFIDSGQALGSFNTWSVTLADIDGDGDIDGMTRSAKWININNPIQKVYLPLILK